jgi:hypothetical protein
MILREEEDGWKGIEISGLPSLSVSNSKVGTSEFYIMRNFGGGGWQIAQTIWSILLAPVPIGLYFTYCGEGLA